MKSVTLAVALCLCLAASMSASGRTGVFAVVEKVVFEPNEANAERIQLWGAFSFVGTEMFRPGSTGTEVRSEPLRGYMYFSLPSGNAEQIKAVRTEWADLKAIAGTGQVVSFGQFMYMGAMTPTGPTGGVYVSVPVGPQEYRGVLLPVLTEAPPAGEPVPYVTNTGLVKIPADGSHAELVKKLRAALAQRAAR